ncbi:MAG: hypothetical protein Q8K75_13050 [Chlamydiales bacterium]|nr:hypothetical protein [Chlamydiales bacterium]
MRIKRTSRNRRNDDENDEGELNFDQEGLALEDPAFKLAPVGLFAVSVNCHHRAESSKGPGPLTPTYSLPSLAELCGEETFADVALAWHQRGFYASVSVEKEAEKCFYPELRTGDSVEFFIDTRDSKASGFNNRFCHHFYFLPKEVNGHSCGEITRFRTEDVHEWCDSNELKNTIHLYKNTYRLDIFIPAHCLHGYDPEQFDRIGFTYRINRPGDDPQHFAVSSNDYAIDQQPSLWASVRLVK